jgi:hypothetical protein
MARNENVIEAEMTIYQILPGVSFFRLIEICGDREDSVCALKFRRLSKGLSPR